MSTTCNEYRLLSIDVGVRTFSFAVFRNTVVPAVVGTCDLNKLNVVSTRMCILTRLLTLLNYLVETFNINTVIVEQQLINTINIRIQMFIQDYCLIRSIYCRLVKAVSTGFGIKKRINRKLFGFYLVQEYLIATGNYIEYNETSKFDVADAVVVGLKYLLISGVIPHVASNKYASTAVGEPLSCGRCILELHLYDRSISCI